MREFYRGRRVLITGHTGFKGAWLAKILTSWGAQVLGYALPPEEGENLYTLLNLGGDMKSVYNDVRDFQSLKNEFNSFCPEVVFHLAAQPLVLRSYEEPRLTYETNVMGTVNLLECVRGCPSVKSVVNITTDKVYKNSEQGVGYSESVELNGYDPYSNSKSCSELVTATYRRCFFLDSEVKVSTARAGNVLGGGDFASNRIIPDNVRAAMSGRAIEIRHPQSIRPYQHVLDALFAYLLLAKRQYENAALAGEYNVGPNREDCVNTNGLTKMFCERWGKSATFTVRPPQHAPHEADFLQLDCTKIKEQLHWSPVWDIERTMDKTVLWYLAYAGNEDINLLTLRQIEEFNNSFEKALAE